MTTEAVELSAELFEELVGDSIYLYIEAQEPRAFELQVTKVRRLPVHALAKRSPFAVDLSGSVLVPLGQGTYFFSHETFGSQPIFIVPVARDGSTSHYEAIFN